MSEGKGEWYCTYCREYLNIQPGFDPSKEKWICTSCRAEVILEEAELKDTRHDYTGENFDLYYRIRQER